MLDIRENEQRGEMPSKILDVEELNTVVESEDACETSSIPAVFSSSSPIKSKKQNDHLQHARKEHG